MLFAVGLRESRPDGLRQTVQNTSRNAKCSRRSIGCQPHQDDHARNTIRPSPPTAIIEAIRLIEREPASASS
ncbi:hypothetical protein KCP73_18635 [Salmonella enterica subsp. enterica]|nr:hypothetical protein KCP73_18635 [Salmonella enterica subsp. enterica]